MPETHRNSRGHHQGKINTTNSQKRSGPSAAAANAPNATGQDGCIVLPAQHPAALARRKNPPVAGAPAGPGSDSAAPANAVQQVYAPGYRALLEVPAAAVRHLPDPGLNVTRLVLCSNYDAADPEGSCPMGSRCKFVHADTRGAREKGGVHVNYAWRSAEEVTYERFRAGKVFQVAPPNGKTATDVMDSQMALKTKALGAKRRPLSHCAHYYFNRACNLGADCQFIHAVFIDPEARKYQRAPIPAQTERGARDRSSPSTTPNTKAAPPLEQPPRVSPAGNSATPLQHELNQHRQHHPHQHQQPEPSNATPFYHHPMPQDVRPTLPHLAAAGPYGQLVYADPTSPATYSVASNASFAVTAGGPVPGGGATPFAAAMPSGGSSDDATTPPSRAFASGTAAVTTAPSGGAGLWEVHASTDAELNRAFAAHGWA